MDARTKDAIGHSPQNAGIGANRSRAKRAHLIAPRDVYITLTSRCNLRCRHCYGSFGESYPGANELDGDEWLGVLRQAADMGVFFVNIAGGEPTIHPDFPRIVDGLTDLNISFILTTNGMATAACLNAINRARSQILGLKISIDGPTAASHGTLRLGLDGKPHGSAFEQSLRTAVYLRDRDIPYTIASCLHRDNIELMTEFEAMLLELRPTSWFLSTISPIGRARQQYREIAASDGRWPVEYWVDLRDRLRGKGIYVRYIDMSVAQRADGQPSPFSCPAATEFCEICADGTVSPCPVSRVVIPKHILDFPNIRQNGLADIWHGPVFSQFRHWRTTGCDGCSVFSECGRCVAQSIQWWQDPDAPPPYCVSKGSLLGLTDWLALQDKFSEKWKILDGISQ